MQRLNDSSFLNDINFTLSKTNMLTFKNYIFDDHAIISDPQIEVKEVCQMMLCSEKRPILKKNFTRHLKIKHSLTRQQYLLQVE